MLVIVVRRLPLLALTALAVSGILLGGAWVAYSISAGYVPVPIQVNFAIGVVIMAMACTLAVRTARHLLRSPASA